MKKTVQPIDCNGNPVFVGNEVKILKLSESLLANLPKEEVLNLRSMIGKTFVIEETDEFGGAWVNLCIYHGDGKNECHSYSLDHDEMVLVSSPQCT